MPIEKAAILPKQYLEAVLSDDIERIDGIKRDKHKMELLLRSLARNESTTATNKRLKDDMKEIAALIKLAICDKAFDEVKDRVAKLCEKYPLYK